MNNSLLLPIRLHLQPPFKARLAIETMNLESTDGKRGPNKVVLRSD
jgi:hypothetical protein